MRFWWGKRVRWWRDVEEQDEKQEETFVVVSVSRLGGQAPDPVPSEWHKFAHQADAPIVRCGLSRKLEKRGSTIRARGYSCGGQSLAPEQL